MKKLVLCILLLAGFSSAALAAEKPMPRVLAALYDSQWESTPRPSQIHRFLEMPANYLGYDVQYYDISGKLPELGDNVAGIVIWFDIGVEIRDPEAYLDWIEKAQKEGKKLIVIENSGFSDNFRKDAHLLKRWNSILGHVGLQDDSRWNQVTYHAAVSARDPAMLDFERKIEPPLPPLTGLHVVAGSHATSHLQIKLTEGGDEDIFDLVVTSPNGGYIAPGYAIYEEDQVRPGEDKWTSEPYFLWYVNPFLFLSKALDVKTAPIPDVTTLDGRRIFYSHLDGDGWNNVTELSAYKEHPTIAAEVIYHEILQRYSDFAFNVGLITGDVDKDCYAVQDSERVAREIFALPNVDPSTHTYSHPLFWEFFANYDPEIEKRFLSRYPPRPKEKFSFEKTIWDAFTSGKWAAPASPDSLRGSKATVLKNKMRRGKNEESVEYILNKYYDTPRSYACSPFDLTQEITGSTNRINEMVPPGKKVKLIQWSGDTSPFETALSMSREAHLYNINGGDSRFDKEYPSYSYVAPIGLKVGSERQIYSSNSNEDTYTNLWTERFYGYRYLTRTVQNTETPRRVSPFNIYFHIFSGEKQASLNAVKENLEYARKQEVIPITATDYAAIAEGFYSTSIEPAGARAWDIQRRGELQTLRFNDADLLAVDFHASSGVLGERYYQHSLYVALDPTIATPHLVLKDNPSAAIPPEEAVPYLIESRWQVSGLKADKTEWSFQTRGYGQGSMVWRVPKGQAYRLTVTGSKNEPVLDKTVTASADGLLPLTISDSTAVFPLTVHLFAQ